MNHEMIQNRENWDELDLQGILWHKTEEKEIRSKRKQVADLLKESCPTITEHRLERLSPKELEVLFRLYDSIFFRGCLGNFGGGFRFSLSKRMTSSAGMTICPRNIAKMALQDVVIEIRIGTDFLHHFDKLEGSKQVGGCEADNALEALQLVFEHELCHAAEFILFQKSSCKAKRFKTMAMNIFGHTGSFHELPTHRKIAEQSMNLHIGDQVSFEHDGQRHMGLLYKINKRAVVMVRDNKGSMADRQGNRYAKYYVPLERLSPCP